MAFMIRIIAPLAITIALSNIISEQAQAFGGGETSCGQYLRAKQRSRDAIDQWILGYATGANEVGQLIFRKDFISGMGEKALFDSVAYYCRRNRSISLQNAAQDFLEYVKQSASRQ